MDYISSNDKLSEPVRTNFSVKQKQVKGRVTQVGRQPHYVRSYETGTVYKQLETKMGSSQRGGPMGTMAKPSQETKQRNKTKSFRARGEGGVRPLRPKSNKNKRKTVTFTIYLSSL